MTGASESSLCASTAYVIAEMYIYGQCDFDYDRVGYAEEPFAYSLHFSNQYSHIRNEQNEQSNNIYLYFIIAMTTDTGTLFQSNETKLYDIIIPSRTHTHTKRDPYHKLIHILIFFHL